MPRKEDIEPPGAANPLNGLAALLGAVVAAKAETLIAEAAATDIDRVMRSVALIARAALLVQALQTAEDKADARALDRKADRAAAAVRANPIPKRPIQDEGDETDMNERDPRLDTPAGVVEIYKSTRQRVDGLLRCLEVKQGDRGLGAEGGGVGAGPELAGEVPPVPTPA